VVCNDCDSRRKIRGHCAVGSVPESGYGVHKRTGNVECCHADVDVENDLPEGGENGGVESLEGKKHLTEVILAILFRREKITMISDLDCHSGGALPDNNVKGGDKWTEIPPPLSWVGITISVQNGVDITPQEGR
jgi:hypothetical protein